MNANLPVISLAQLGVAMIPGLGLLVLMQRWSHQGWRGLHANARMLAQLLVIGYVLSYLFTTDLPEVVAIVLLVMTAAAAWIGMGSMRAKNASHLLLIFAVIAVVGGLMLALVTQWVLKLPTAYEPRFLIPLAGMIFSNVMNVVSLAGERFEGELDAGRDLLEARNTAFRASMIPQLNALFAVGVVALPGMMTGQIIAGTDPLIAVRYQVVVMSMIFAASGWAALAYLWSRQRWLEV